MDRDEPAALPLGMLSDHAYDQDTAAGGDPASARTPGETLPRLCLPPQDAAPSVSTDAGPSPAQILEALLFSAADPVSAVRLAELSGLASPAEVPDLMASLNETYAAAGLSFRIEAVARGYRLMTLPQFSPWIEKLNQQQALTRLSPAALETLAIVAYRQPVIRADIEAIRGVASGEVLNRLREIGLVRIVGRAEIIGRPLLYGTTRRFLDVFGLANLSDLPPLEALNFTASLPLKANPPAAAPVPPPRAAAGM